MHNGLSLRAQFNIWISAISLIILIAGGVIAIWEARSSVKTELDSSLNLATQLIRLNFPHDGKQGEVDVDAWLPRFISLDQTRHLSIQLKRAVGNTVNFSARTRATQETAPPNWFVWLISAQSPITEQHLTNTDGESVSLVLQANPIDEISEAWQESRTFFATLVLMTAIIFLAINLLFNKTIKPVTIIVEGLKAIEQGNYQVKLPYFSTQEYGSIAKAINHTADALEASYKENKTLTLHTLQIQEDERQLLAKELHDELGQSLTAIKIMATASKSDKADSDQIADTICSVCDHLVTVVRSIMRNLHPLVLTELGLKASLEDLLNHWSLRQPELSLTLKCPDTFDKMDQKITIQVFRVVQECLTNIVRHAQATEASVHLELTSDNWLKLEISDNGMGFKLTETQKGF